MMAQSVIQRSKQTCAALLAQPNIRKASLCTLYASAGFFLSGGALGLQPQPLTMGLLTALSGWRCTAATVGSMAGYLFFWSHRGIQGVIWALLGGITGILLSGRPVTERIPLLVPALCALEIAATGLFFQAMGWEDTALFIYLLRIGIGAGAARIFAQIITRASPIADWLGLGMGVLALAQAAPVPWLNFGCIAASVITLRDAFPAAALAGLALSLSGISRSELAGTLCIAYLLRLIPGIPDRILRLAPAAVYLLMMPLTGIRDFRPLPALLIGGFLSCLFPQRTKLHARRGETGAAQVHLELMADVLAKMQQQLMLAALPPIDEATLMAKTKERACGSCPNRKKCAVEGDIPLSLLRRPILDAASLPFPCRKPGRMILELRRTQERYRNIRADRERCREYRSATAQQYGFLAQYLRRQSDSLPRRGTSMKIRYYLESNFASSPKSEANGDKCTTFYTSNGFYCLLLCDGMGTGLGAADLSHTAAIMLQQMLQAGFTPEEALQSLNNLLTLQGHPGAVSVDLAQISVVTGNGILYKWGAPGSYLLRDGIATKIGTAGPPPGIGVDDAHMTAQRLSLRGGEVLIMISDGVDGEKAFSAGIQSDLPPGELAARLLQRGGAAANDDATVLAARLNAVPLVNIIPPQIRKCCRNTRYGTKKG